VVRHYGGVDEPPRPDLRIGDRERRAVDAHLQQAHGDGVLTLTEYDERAARCWAARTQAELAELVRDLPPYRPGPDEEPTAVVAAPEAAQTKPLGQRLAGGAVGVAIAGVALFLGAQVLTSDDGMAVMGSRTVTVGADQDRVEVGAMFGNVRVVVPEGVRARVTGPVVFGSTECDLACNGQGREVEVEVAGAFGSIDVLRPGELTADEAEDAAEEREDAIEDAREDD
jgi:Domain of unknown function (DUF1707)